MPQITVSNIPILVNRKAIKNVHLTVLPPDGLVRISAPMRMELDTIRAFAASKLGWIKKQRAKMQAQPREIPREYVNRETHYFRGKPYRLKVIEKEEKPRVVYTHREISLQVRPGSDQGKREEVLQEWYRQEMKQQVQQLIVKWEDEMQVEVAEFGVKQMKTRWGTCNIAARRIWLNLELIKKPPHCLEYVVVHEMTHFFERYHNDRFKSILDRYYPTWREVQKELNALPL